MKILIEADGIDVVDDASNAQEVFRKVGREHYNLVLLDISMPGPSGMEVLKQLQLLQPDLPVLILSTYPEEIYAIRALKAGAAGYLTKNAAPEQLCTAVFKVASGGKYVSASLAERMAFDLGGAEGKEAHDQLSDREFEIMCKIAAGKTVREIATGLSLSSNTISTYRTRILHKLHMKTSAQITYYAIKNQLVD